MKTISEQLFALGKGIIESKPEVTNALYAAADDGGVENETGEFLYGLVRLMKPKKILTTGIYTGMSDMYIAQGRKDNGVTESGNHHALEIDQSHIDRAKKLWSAVGVNDLITTYNIPSLEFDTDGKYDLLFLDSEPHLRFAELVKFFPNLTEGGYVLIHDLHGHLGQGGPVNPDHPDIPNWPFGTLPEQIKSWLKDDYLRVIPLPAPRGLVLFYKTTEGDFVT